MTQINSLVRRVLKESSLALVTKLIGAPVNFIMVVALARAMTFETYGEFVFAFSIVMILGQAATAGQPQLMLRLLPGFEEAGAEAQWRAALRHGLRLVLAAGLLATVAMIAGALALGAGGYMILAAPLCLLFAFAQFQAAILRTRGKVVWAIGPRDILWRLTLIALCGIVLLFSLPPLPSWGVFAFGVVSLALLLLWQSRADRTTRYRSALAGPVAGAEGAWRNLSTRYWITALVIFGTPNLAVVIVGTVLDVTESGPFFAALRTAQLMQLILIASNIAATPLISRYHAAGDTAAVQSISAVVASLAGAAAVVGFVILLFLAGPILSLFGEGFEAARASLLILAVGFAISALNGANGPLLQMTGHEKPFNRIIVGANGLGLVCLVPAVWLGGAVGGALAVSGAMILWNVLAWRACRELTGIDPSILGALRHIRAQRS
ncbi:lipopolysaccharide biosynthesis protein [Roseisalinus antarcticus]|uniref:Polysaccharide biosynthesis protein n=1 Tax=Roseisalinus antarcticus TaxID=254357 RepID=A0A1Y5TPY5_9RHOB|nr:hypothetical protein [Roseisalinus antarcticus]SLN69233.1 hypothetical protein ROA7023_03369 [Roseisalinus antarcticus]